MGKNKLKKALSEDDYWEVSGLLDDAENAVENAESRIDEIASAMSGLIMDDDISLPDVKNVADKVVDARMALEEAQSDWESIDTEEDLAQSRRKSVHKMKKQRLRKSNRFKVILQGVEQDGEWTSEVCGEKVTGMLNMFNWIQKNGKIDLTFTGIDDDSMKSIGKGGRMKKAGIRKEKKEEVFKSFVYLVQESSKIINNLERYTHNMEDAFGASYSLQDMCSDLSYYVSHLESVADDLNYFSEYGEEDADEIEESRQKSLHKSKIDTRMRKGRGRFVRKDETPNPTEEAVSKPEELTAQGNAPEGEMSETDEIAEPEELDKPKNAPAEEISEVDDVDKPEDDTNMTAGTMTNPTETEPEGLPAKKRVHKFSVTDRGSERYNGRERYIHSPMMQECIDRTFGKDKAEKELAQSLNKRMKEINSSQIKTDNPISKRRIR